MSYSKTIFAIAFLTILTSVSCIKKDPLAQISQVLMVPLSPDAAAVDFVINDLVQATTVNYSATVGTAIYNFPYYTITPGNTKVTYNISGTTVAYASITGPIDPETAYSTFLIDSVKRAKLVITKDDVSEPPEGKVKLRFLHFSPNAPAMDISKSGGAVLFTNRSFNDQETNTAFQKFIVVDPGSYQFLFKTSGTTTTLVTAPTINLLPDRIYTLAARGIFGVTGTNKALSAWWYANRP